MGITMNVFFGFIMAIVSFYLVFGILSFIELNKLLNETEALDDPGYEEKNSDS
ncbi:MAG: hypothetical protein LHV68_06335 [Elusimicrobia bacterium]|nr:hypothetical protein [Candidatus Liberimonas magnetica]